MSSHITALDYQAWQFSHQLQMSMQGKMSDAIGMGSSVLDSVKIMLGMAHKQAFVLGYQKIVRILAFGYLLSLLPLILLKKKEGASSKPVMDSH